MPILSDQPQTIPPKAEKVFNEVWIRNLQITLGGCNGEPVRLNAEYGLACREGGVGQFYPGLAPTMHIEDLYAAAAEDPELGALISQVVDKVINMAKAQNLV